ncbi:MAG: ATP-binding cassette domain-containing protein [Pseudomonadaceae bacterium]|nr:ATP-binding cassette domain-containing protein [Pseudomonadaceae bacterium]
MSVSPVTEPEQHFGADGIVFDRVSKRFGATKVLSDLSVALPAGVTSAIVGASGSGKSTMLKLANGIHRADSGEVTVLGTAIPDGDLSVFRRRFGYAVQGAALFPHLSGFDNVVLMSALAGWPPQRQKERYEQLAELVGLEAGVGERYPHELSGGQQQRLGLCRAFMLEPEILLLDEPFSAVDPITRMAIHDEFQRLQKQLGPTAVLVTHDMAEALKLAEFIVVLKDGQIEQAGAANAIADEPASDYVRTLFAAAGMSL